MLSKSVIRDIKNILEQEATIWPDVPRMIIEDNSVSRYRNGTEWLAAKHDELKAGDYGAWLWRVYDESTGAVHRWVR